MAPAPLKNIEELAFENCKNLKHVDLSACTLQSCNGDPFMNDAFRESGIESIVFPSKLRVIRERVFAGCNNLKSVVFEGNSELE